VFPNQFVPKYYQNNSATSLVNSDNRRGSAFLSSCCEKPFAVVGQKMAFESRYQATASVNSNGLRRYTVSDCVFWYNSESIAVICYEFTGLNRRDS
jgi:hypothetical protein